MYKPRSSSQRKFLAVLFTADNRTRWWNSAYNNLFVWISAETWSSLSEAFLFVSTYIGNPGLYFEMPSNYSFRLALCDYPLTSLDAARTLKHMQPATRCICNGPWDFLLFWFFLFDTLSSYTQCEMLAAILRYRSSFPLIPSASTLHNTFLLHNLSSPPPFRYLLLFETWDVAVFPFHLFNFL